MSNLEEQFRRYEGTEEPGEEKDEEQLANEAWIRQMESAQDEMHELSNRKRRLERLKSIKAEGDEYLSIYPEGYQNTIHGQKDFEVEDLLSRMDEAKTIARKIESGEVKTAGVFGDWGTGKSTFLGYIKSEIETDNISTIRIDASEYSDQEKIWAYIYSAIRDEFNVKFGRKCKFFFRRIRKNWLYVLLNVIISACLIFWWLIR